MPLLEELIKEWSAQELIELNSALRTVPQIGNRYRLQCHSYQKRAALLTSTQKLAALRFLWQETISPRNAQSWVEVLEPLLKLLFWFHHYRTRFLH